MNRRNFLKLSVAAALVPAAIAQARAEPQRETMSIDIYQSEFGDLELSPDGTHLYKQFDEDAIKAEFRKVFEVPEERQGYRFSTPFDVSSFS